MVTLGYAVLRDGGVTSNSGPPYESKQSINREKGLDPEFLRNTTQDLIEALTSQPYVEAMLAVRAAPDEERLLEASKRLTPDALRALGVPLPSEMRISSRYFETGFPDSIDVELGDPPAGGVNLIEALNEVRPGFLDDLRLNHPDIYQTVIAPREASAISPTARFGYCNCGGRDFSGPISGTVCGGAGAHI